jgi:hypothetical protein
MHSVDGQSSYSYVQLEDMLISLMHTYQPTEIHTQANYLDPWFPDHSDHTAVSRLVTKVGQKYDSKVPIKYYIGYPIYSRPSNVSGALLQQKNDAFFTYAKSDPSVCRNFETCVKSHASYSNYLPRQYTSP